MLFRSGGDSGRRRPPSTRREVLHVDPVLLAVGEDDMALRSADLTDRRGVALTVRPRHLHARAGRVRDVAAGHVLCRDLGRRLGQLRPLERGFAFRQVAHGGGDGMGRSDVGIAIEYAPRA